MFRAQSEDPGPLVVAGPSGIERFVRHTLEDLRYRIDYELRFVQWSEGSDDLALEWNGCRLLWQPLDHSTACVGYRIEEAARPGRFDTDKARDLGVPQGPLFGRLQAGETVTAADGRRVSPGEVLGPARRGRIVTYATDTLPCPGLERLCSGADLAFVEGMFTSAHEAEAAAKKHMTAAQAGEIAARAGAARLVLLHVSPRYSLADEGTLGAEARARHPRAEVGRQLESYPVLLPE